jgi:uncharacterized protein
VRIYQDTITRFIQDTLNNKIADIIRDRFEEYYGRRANPSEVVSWTNSLQFLKNAVEYASPPDNMVALEFELPYSTQRIDCLLFGRGDDGKDNVVVIELKQWSDVKDCDIEDNVVTFVGGSDRMVPHPSLQVRGYHYYLADFLEVFHQSSDPIALSSCVYCHNYPRTDDAVLLLPKFQEILEEFPVYTKDDFRALGDFLKSKIEKGSGLEVFGRFATSNIKPSKKLIELTSAMIAGQKVFNLIDDQITANNTIIDRARKCTKLKRKSVIVVRGGPGTGKSLIALNALAELIKKGIVVYHATGSKSFTETLRKVVGHRAAKLFKYFNSFSTYGENDIAVLICDEAHRIRTSSNNRYTRTDKRSTLPQVDELVKVAKVSIFFIDDNQVVRPEEIGNSSLIRDAAAKYRADTYDFELKSQFRCSGSDGYLNWLDNTLMIRETANTYLTKNEKMDFRIFDDPNELYAAIKEKNRLKPNSARMVAGFCWPWSDPNPDGTLVEDVVIGSFKMPWEGKGDKKLAKGIPYWYQWAYDAGGVNQCGCIYTTQGFEFDYIGVIIGNDLVYDPLSKAWIGKRENSKDPQLKRAGVADFTSYAKNIYRVLLTRGMQGCYVCFLDENTRNFFETRMFDPSSERSRVSHRS